MGKRNVKLVVKPWGYELIFALTERYAGKILFVKAGCRLSDQYHIVKNETLYLSSGLLAILVTPPGEKCVGVYLREGEAINFPPFCAHRIKALVDSFIYEVSTPELDDVVRLEDDYGRA